MKKFWFPKLAQHLTDSAVTKTEFFAKAFGISEAPKSRTWANAMNKEHGVSETYANKCKKIMLKLDYPADVVSFEAIGD